MSTLQIIREDLCGFVDVLLICDGKWTLKLVIHRLTGFLVSSLENGIYSEMVVSLK